MNKHDILTTSITATIVVTFSFLITGITIESITAYIYYRPLQLPSGWDEIQRICHIISTMLTVLGSIFIRFKIPS